MEILTINNKQDAREAIEAIDCTAEGTAIMSEKAVFKVVKVQKVNTKAANILKQTFLSKGGEVALSRHCADFSEEYTDIIIMATLKQYRAAIAVLMIQPLDLKQLGLDLKALLSL